MNEQEYWRMMKRQINIGYFFDLFKHHRNRNLLTQWIKTFLFGINRTLCHEYHQGPNNFEILFIQYMIKEHQCEVFQFGGRLIFLMLTNEDTHKFHHFENITSTFE